MQESDILAGLAAVCGEEAVLLNVPLKEYTTMRVGGKADMLVQPDSADRVREVILFLNERKIPYFVMGNGSNLIFSDEGYSGVIVKIGPRLSKIEVLGETIVAEGGATLAAVAGKALENELAGFEFASGIPGTIGGGAAMNAGAYDGEMKQVILETLSLDKHGNFVTLTGEQHEFSYRRSRIQDDRLTVVRVTLGLKKGNRQAISDKMNDLNGRRRDKQPLAMPSAGSVFKRPPGYFAGKLIEDCGLKGFSIGGAQVSEKHCGFIVNTGNAKASDVIALIRHIQNTVYEKTGVMLEPEVKIIGGN